MIQVEGIKKVEEDGRPKITLVELIKNDLLIKGLLKNMAFEDKERT